MRPTRHFLLTVVFCLFFNEKACATHSRAGEITAKRVPGNPLAYDVTYTGYFVVSPAGFGAADGQTFVLMYFYAGDTDGETLFQDKLTGSHH